MRKWNRNRLKQVFNCFYIVSYISWSLEMAGQLTSSRNATFVWTMLPCCACFCSIRWWLLSWSIFPSTCVRCRAVSFISCVSFFRLLRMKRCDTAVSTNYINITLPNPINLKPRQIEDGVSPLFPMTFVLVIREKTYLPSKASSCHGSKVLQLYWFGLILKVGCQQFLQPQVQVPVGFKPSMNTMIWKDVL